MFVIRTIFLKTRCPRSVQYCALYPYKPIRAVLFSACLFLRFSSQQNPCVWGRYQRCSQTPSVPVSQGLEGALGLVYYILSKSYEVRRLKHRERNEKLIAALATNKDFC